MPHRLDEPAPFRHSDRVILQLVCAAAALSTGCLMLPWLVQGRYRLEGDVAPAPFRSMVWVIPVCTVTAFLVARQVSPWYGAAAAGAATWLVLISAIDLHVRRLPDRWTGAGAVLIPLALAAVAAAGGHAQPLQRALLAEIVLTAVYLVLAIVGRGGLGLGDVKLAAGMGAILGYRSWQDLATATLLTFVLGAVVGGVLLVAAAVRRQPRPTEIPFGPFMAAGAIVTLVASSP